MDKNLLNKILRTFGPSGHEEAISQILRDFVAPHADEVYSDKLGNLIAVKRGTSGKKIMLAAHMDQIGLIVVGIDDKGFARVNNVGGVNPIMAVGRPVVFGNGTQGLVQCDRLAGGIGTATMANLFIDLGCNTREEALEKIDIGDMCIFGGEPVEMGSRMFSPTMDDRICCAAQAEAFVQMKSEHDVYCVFTTQEEVGLRGAGVAAFHIEPDLGISMDVTGTGDTPEALTMAVELGKGPTVKMMDSSVIVPVCVRNFMIEAAEEAGIPYQREILRAGGTDTAAIQRTRGGILSGCISIPTRYIHSPVECIDMNDYENAIKLLVACLAKKELPQR